MYTYDTGEADRPGLTNASSSAIWIQLLQLNETSLYAGCARDRAVRLTFIVMMVIFSIAGFLGNVLIIITITFVRDLRNTRNAFLVNLALSDLILIGIVVPFNIVSVVHGADYWKDKVTLCQIVASVCAPGCLSAIWSNTAVALNRFVFICHNELYDGLFSPRKTLAWIALVWAIAFSIHLPNHVGWGHNGYVDQFFLCTRETNLWSYSLFFGAGGIILPLSISFYAYCCIYRLVRTTKAARKQITMATIAKAVPSTTQSDRRASISLLMNTWNAEQESGPVFPVANLVLVTKTKKARKIFHRELVLVRTLFRTFAVFLVAWLPLAILLMVPMTDVPTWVYLTTVFLAHGSTATNSFMYYLTNDSFHRGFVKLVNRVRRLQLSPSFGTTDSSSTGAARES